jgi:1-deoxy-D-xylulose-5-phosphate synthase
MHLPDVFQDQDSPAKMYDVAKLNAQHIVERAREALGMGANVVNLHG